METLVKYLEYDKAKDFFIWNGNQQNLEDFVLFALNETDRGEWSNDPAHSAATYKLNGCKTRFYMSTKRLVLQGHNHTILKEKFLDLLSGGPTNLESEAEDGDVTDESFTTDLVAVSSSASENVFAVDDILGNTVSTSPTPTPVVSSLSPSSHSSGSSTLHQNTSASASSSKHATPAPGPESTLSQLGELRKDVDYIMKVLAGSHFIEINKLREENTKLRLANEVLQAEKEGLVKALSVLNSSILATTQQNNNNNWATMENREEKTNAKMPSKSKQKKQKKQTPRSNALENPSATHPPTSQPANGNSSSAKRHSHKPDSSEPPATPSRTVVILGDSMIKEIQGWKLSKDPRAVVKSFSGSTVADMHHYIKPTLVKNPDEILIHIGTNDVRTTSSPQTITDSIVDLCESVQQQTSGADITVSGIILRNDNPQLNSVITKVNKSLRKFCHQRNWHFIDNANIDPLTCLNRSKLHLNRKGTYLLSNNFRSHILSNQ